jgi:hypothetical protein
MPLRKADITNSKRFEDGQDWIVLRVGGLTKGESDQLRDLTAAFKMDPRAFAGEDDQAAMVEINNRVAQANRALFEILCVDWSLGEVSGAAYSELDEESGRWVDEQIAEVLAERRKRAEGNGSSKRKPRARGSSSAKAAASS